MQSTVVLLVATILLGVITIISAIATYLNQKEDQDQKNKIQLLTEQTKKLSELNNALTKNVQEITSSTKEITKGTHELSKENRSLITNVQGLAERAESLIKIVDERTARSAAENLQTGELKMNFSPTFAPGDDLNLRIGINMGIPTARILEGHFFKQIFQGINFEPITFRIKENKLVISLKIFDVDGNLIAEVKDNYWRPNRNFFGRFNYDETGFEVIDNQGNVAIQIDIMSDNTISVQGVFRSKIEKVMIIATKSNYAMIPFNDPKKESEYKNGAEDYYQTISRLVAEINPMFEYFAEDWLHKRLKPKIKLLQTSYFNPNEHIGEERPQGDFLFGFEDVEVLHKGKLYKAKISCVDDRKPERVLFRINDWDDKPDGISSVMLERTGGKNGNEWQNSRPMDIHDESFIKDAISTLKSWLTMNFGKY